MEIKFVDILKQQTIKMNNRAKSFKKIDEYNWQGEIIERFNMC